MRSHLKALIAVLPAILAGNVAAQQVRQPAALVTGPVTAMVPPTVVAVPSNSAFYAPPGSFIARMPVVIFPDGRVFAQFGNGFEQVVRGCPGGTAVISSVLPGPVQPRVVQPTVIQPPAVVTQPLPYNPPIPGQQLVAQPLDWTGASQILAGQTMIMSSTGCWAVNGYGQVFVYHP